MSTAVAAVDHVGRGQRRDEKDVVVAGAADARCRRRLRGKMEDVVAGAAVEHIVGGVADQRVVAAIRRSHSRSSRRWRW